MSVSTLIVGFVNPSLGMLLERLKKEMKEEESRRQAAETQEQLSLTVAHSAAAVIVKQALERQQSRVEQTANEPIEIEVISGL